MSRFRVLKRAWGAVLIHAALSASGQQGGITNEGPYTVFRTDANDALLTLSLPFDVPGTNVQPRLDFIFGFSTDEPAAAATFFDSFSVTMQNTNQTTTALLLTADRSGVDWAPANPGGLPIAPAELRYVARPFPGLAPPMSFLGFHLAIGTSASPGIGGRGPRRSSHEKSTAPSVTDSSRTVAESWAPCRH
jgi:hypothetical protein